MSPLRINDYQRKDPTVLAGQIKIVYSTNVTTHHPGFKQSDGNFFRINFVPSSTIWNKALCSMSPSTHRDSHKCMGLFHWSLSKLKPNCVYWTHVAVQTKYPWWRTENKHGHSVQLAELKVMFIVLASTIPASRIWLASAFLNCFHVP